MAGHVGRVHYGDPRAAQVAGKYLEGYGPDDSTPHSVVHGSISVESDSVEQAKQIMAAWDRAMNAFNASIQSILDPAG